MTCTFIAAMAIGALAPGYGEELTERNCVMRDPVIAPYSELVLFHASIEGQTKNHSLWLIAEQGKGRRIAQEAVDPVCIGVLPDKPVAVVADHTTPNEQYWLASLRTGEVLAKVPDYDLKVRRTLRDQLTKNLLLVATDEEGALGLYRFPVDAWFKASPEGRPTLKPTKIWSLTTDPVDLVFSRDGGRIAMLNGNDIQLLTIGEEVTSRTLVFPGSVVHPRDFHPSLNVLVYESVTAMPGFADPFGEIGVLDLTTGQRRTAVYVNRLLEPDKQPKFDASGSFFMFSVPADLREGGGTVLPNLVSQRYKEPPRPYVFPIVLSRPNISFLMPKAAPQFATETLRPICVTYRYDREFLDAVGQFAEPIGELTDHAYNSLRLRAKGAKGQGSSGHVDYLLNWYATAVFSPSAPGRFFDIASAEVIGTVPSVVDHNGSALLLFDAHLPPCGFLYGEGFHECFTHCDIYLTDDVVLFGSPFYGTVRNYPTWSHYGP